MRTTGNGRFSLVARMATAAAIGLGWAGDDLVRAEEASRVKVVGANEGARTCDAVVVSDGALIHTGQIFPVGDDGRVVGTTAEEQANAVLWRLDKTLRAAGGSGVAGLVRVTAYAASDEAAVSLAKTLPVVLGKETAIAWNVMSGKMPAEPAGALVSVEAVALGPTGEGSSADQVVHFGRDGAARTGEFSATSTLPAGDVIYISGQAEKGTTLEEATEKTLAGLAKTLTWLGLSEADVVETRSFVQPVDKDLSGVKERFRRAFEGRPIPASTFLEWTSAHPSIEIEYVVSSRRVPWAERIKTLGSEVAADETVAYLTPPWMTASPVYCRVAHVRRGNLVYFGSVTGDPAAEGGEIRDLFRRLDRTAQAAGCDLRHLAKATYFVANAELVPQMGKIRPEFYDPRRPPAASLATVRGIAGEAGRGVRIDMIGSAAKSP